MTKQNGQAAQPENSAKMAMLGSVRLMLEEGEFRKLVAGEKICVEFGNARELELQIEPGPQNRFIELDPWFDVYEAKIRVGTSFAQDGCHGSNFFLADSIEFNLIETENSKIGLILTAEQAKALASALMNYARAWEACEALEGETTEA